MSELTSLFFYLTVFLVSSFFLYIGNKKGFAPATVVGLMLPILLATLRAGVGSDYENYMRHYGNTDMSYTDFNEFNGTWTMEPTFWIFSNISRFLTNDSTLMFALYSAVTVIFFYLAVKRLKIMNVGLAMFLYYCFWFGVSFSAVRQFAAISIFMYALQFLIDGSLRKYIFWIIIASLFHVTSLLLIPIFFLRKIIRKGKKFLKNNMYRTLLFTIVAMVVSVGVLPLMMGLFIQLPVFEKYTYMMSRTRDEVIIGGTFLFQLLILFSSLMFYKGVIGFSYRKAMYLILFALGVSLYMFGFLVEFAYRFSLYFLPIAVLLLAGSTDFYKRFFRLYGLSMRSLPFIILGLLGVVYFILVYFLSERFGIFPYNFIWQEIV